MIKGYCRTNLDDFKTQEWPRCFAALPRYGDRISSAQGRVLYVVGITHGVAKADFILGDIRKGDPYIEIELHKFSAVSRK